jgi:hypothetical protein
MPNPIPVMLPVSVFKTIEQKSHSVGSLSHILTRSVAVTIWERCNVQGYSCSLRSAFFVGCSAAALASAAVQARAADYIPDNGQVERMNRTIKDATVKRYFYETHDQLRVYLRDFVDAYNFARRLKTLRGLTPYEFVCKAWTSEPQRFKLNPLQQTPGLHI